MAYKVIREDGTQSVELVEAGKVYQSFETEWTCDPCNRSNKRYEVLHPSGMRFHPWYEVITQDDDQRTRDAKISFSIKVAEAENELNAATLKLRRMTGN